jgi:hypothetical protein
MKTFEFAEFGEAFHSSQMIRLLQRMDDSEPRHPVAGKVAASFSPELRSLLADADESAEQALDDWARGLDWVEWLFSSVRQRMTHLHFQPMNTGEVLKLRLAWENFAHGIVVEVYAPHLIAAWQAVQTGSVADLIESNRAFAATLSHEQSTRSCEAGRLLLKGTRGARYQGILGHFRSACEADETPGHFLTVWAAVGHFFQLSLTNVIAEYLRLEWALATRHLPGQPRLHGLPELTARLMQGRQHELRVVA